MPTVAMNVPERKAPSLNWSRKQVFPTPESPSNITCKMGAGRGISGTEGRGAASLSGAECPPSPLCPSVSFPRAGPAGFGSPVRAEDGMRPPKGAAKRCPSRAAPSHWTRGKQKRRAGGNAGTAARRDVSWLSPSPGGSWRTGCRF